LAKRRGKWLISELSISSGAGLNPNPGSLNQRAAKRIVFSYHTIP
jgi:hypothetical protein